ncbi:MAG: sugar-binding transcriptional regulator [Thermoflexales bacterium]|nr:sugar-binding transcriptional regulator [Thermoflexales bacterium]
MTRNDDQHLLLQTARMYYEDNRTQEQIARALSLSRPTISRLLQQAREDGIVEIRVIDPQATNRSLEKQLMATFALRDVVVVAVEDSPPDLARRRVGQAAARFLARTVQSGETVGLGWGRTLHEVALALEPRRKARVTIVPLIGGVGQISPVFQVHELARHMAEAFGGTWRSFYAPAMLETEEAAAMLRRLPDLQQVMALWDHLDCAVVGIGNFALSTEIEMLFVNYLSEATQQRLVASHAVGDLCVRFFDVSGRPCPEAVPGVLGVSLDQLKATRRTIGVAGGAEKAEAILGALRGGFVNTLILDEPAARRVLALAAEGGA